MKTYFLTAALILSLALSAFTNDNAASPLPRDLAEWEYGLPLPHTDNPTPPPSEPCRALTEWEETEAIIFRWGEYNDILWQIIDKVVEVTKAYIICSSQAQASSCRSFLISQGVSPIDSVEFMVQPTNSVWIRDYAPWWLWRLESWDRAMYEWDYNRPRPLDDVIPEWLSQLWGIEYYGLDLTHTGGNWLLDGWSRAYCSGLILQENWGLTPRGVTNLFSSYASLDTVPLTPTFYGIDHLNMSAKLLNDHTVMINQYPAGSPYNDEMEQTVQVFSNLTNQYGQPFKIIRVQTPNWGGIPYTYCNSLTVMNRVIVPVYNQHPFDEDALALYAENMPGYDIFSINCNSIIPASGAINCITHNIPNSELIYITHAPLHDTENTTQPYPVVCQIACLGTLDQDSLHVYWRSDVNPAWSQVPLIHTTGIEYTASIPPCPGGKVEYYIRAVSEGGCWTTTPRYGPAAHNQFIAGPFQMQLTLTPQNPPIIIPPGGGNFSYHIDIANNASFPRQFDVWAYTVTPAGDTLDNISRNDITLAANSSLSRNITQFVPASAPGGAYTYAFDCGQRWANTVFAGDFFNFTKTPGNDALNYSGKWQSYGWDGETAITSAPANLSLKENYPNPFNMETTFKFDIPSQSEIKIEIFNITGRKTADLFSGTLSAGEYSYTWNARNLASGIYYVRLSSSAGVNSTRKVLLLK